MKISVRHGWSEETPEAKARWWQSLTMEERAEYFDEFMEFILELNPDLLKQKARDAKPVPGRIQVLTLP